MKMVKKTAVAVMIMAGFLLMCSETLPGDLETSVWAVLAQEVIGFGILGFGFWIASKIEER